MTCVSSKMYFHYMVSVLLYSILSLLHPIYITTYHIEINPTGEWHASIRLFFDDLEDAIHNQEGKRPTLTTEHLMEYHEPISTYLQTHFQVIDTASSGQFQYEIIEMERTGDVITIRLEGDTTWDTDVRIYCNVLLELFASQKNIIEIKFPNEEMIYCYLHRSLQEEIIAIPND